MIAINGVSVKGMSFDNVMAEMKSCLRQGSSVTLRFRTMEERYRLLRMKVTHLLQVFLHPRQGFLMD